MNHVISAKANENLTLELTFDDGSVRLFNAKPYIGIGIFTELTDPDYFRDIRVSFGTVQWKNGQDFAPETLYAESSEIAKVELRK